MHSWLNELDVNSKKYPNNLLNTHHSLWIYWCFYMMKKYNLHAIDARRLKNLQWTNIFSQILNSTGFPRVLPLAFLNPVSGRMWRIFNKKTYQRLWYHSTDFKIQFFYEQTDLSTINKYHIPTKVGCENQYCFWKTKKNWGRRTWA